MRNVMEFKYTSRDLQGNELAEISYKVYEGSGIDEVMQEFRRFLLAVSFAPETVDKYIEAE